MTSITIKNIPENLLDQVRKRAMAERRSVNKELIELVTLALRDEQAGPLAREQTAKQVAEWSALSGGWKSDANAAAETRAIYHARTSGRAVDL